MEKYDVDLPMSFLGEEGLALSEYAEFIITNVKKSGSDISSENSSETNITTITETTKISQVTQKDAEKFISESLRDVLGMTLEDMKSFGKHLAKKAGMQSHSFSDQIHLHPSYHSESTPYRSPSFEQMC